MLLCLVADEEGNEGDLIVVAALVAVGAEEHRIDCLQVVQDRPPSGCWFLLLLVASAAAAAAAFCLLLLQVLVLLRAPFYTINTYK